MSSRDVYAYRLRDELYDYRPVSETWRHKFKSFIPRKMGSKQDREQAAKQPRTLTVLLLDNSSSY